jgi:hypothetical protein
MGYVVVAKYANEQTNGKNEGGNKQIFKDAAVEDAGCN